MTQCKNTNVKEIFIDLPDRVCILLRGIKFYDPLFCVKYYLVCCDGKFSIQMGINSGNCNTKNTSINFHNSNIGDVSTMNIFYSGMIEYDKKFENVSLATNTFLEWYEMYLENTLNFFMFIDSKFDTKTDLKLLEKKEIMNERRLCDVAKEHILKQYFLFDTTEEYENSENKFLTEKDSLQRFLMRRANQNSSESIIPVVNNRKIYKYIEECFKNAVSGYCVVRNKFFTEIFQKFTSNMEKMGKLRSLTLKSSFKSKCKRDDKGNNGNRNAIISAYISKYNCSKVSRKAKSICDFFGIDSDRKNLTLNDLVLHQLKSSFFKGCMDNNSICLETTNSMNPNIFEKLVINEDKKKSKTNEINEDKKNLNEGIIENIGNDNSIFCKIDESYDVDKSTKLTIGNIEDIDFKKNQDDEEKKIAKHLVIAEKIPKDIKRLEFLDDIPYKNKINDSTSIDEVKNLESVEKTDDLESKKTVEPYNNMKTIEKRKHDSNIVEKHENQSKKIKVDELLQEKEKNIVKLGSSVDFTDNAKKNMEKKRENLLTKAIFMNKEEFDLLLMNESKFLNETNTKNSSSFVCDENDEKGVVKRLDFYHQNDEMCDWQPDNKLVRDLDEELQEVKVENTDILDLEISSNIDDETEKTMEDNLLEKSIDLTKNQMNKINDENFGNEMDNTIKENVEKKTINSNIDNEIIKADNVIAGNRIDVFDIDTESETETDSSSDFHLPFEHTWKFKKTLELLDIPKEATQFAYEIKDKKYFCTLIVNDEAYFSELEATQEKAAESAFTMFLQSVNAQFFCDKKAMNQFLADFGDLSKCENKKRRSKKKKSKNRIKHVFGDKVVRNGDLNEDAAKNDDFDSSNLENLIQEKNDGNKISIDKTVLSGDKLVDENDFKRESIAANTYNTFDRNESDISNDNMKNNLISFDKNPEKLGDDSELIENKHEDTRNVKSNANTSKFTSILSQYVDVKKFSENLYDISDNRKLKNTEKKEKLQDFYLNISDQKIKEKDCFNTNKKNINDSSKIEDNIGAFLINDKGKINDNIDTIMINDKSKTLIDDIFCGENSDEIYKTISKYKIEQNTASLSKNNDKNKKRHKKGSSKHKKTQNLHTNTVEKDTKHIYKKLKGVIQDNTHVFAVNWYCRELCILFPEYMIEKQNDVFICTADFLNNKFSSKYFFKKDEAKEDVCKNIYNFVLMKEKKKEKSNSPHVSKNSDASKCASKLSGNKSTKDHMNFFEIKNLRSIKNYDFTCNEFTKDNVSDKNIELTNVERNSYSKLDQNENNAYNKHTTLKNDKNSNNKSELRNNPNKIQLFDEIYNDLYCERKMQADCNNKMKADRSIKLDHCHHREFIQNENRKNIDFEKYNNNDSDKSRILHRDFQNFDRNRYRYLMNSEYEHRKQNTYVFKNEFNESYNNFYKNNNNYIDLEKNHKDYRKFDLNDNNTVTHTEKNKVYEDTVQNTFKKFSRNQSTSRISVESINQQNSSPSNIYQSKKNSITSQSPDKNSGKSINAIENVFEYPRNINTIDSPYNYNFRYDNLCKQDSSLLNDLHQKYFQNKIKSNVSNPNFECKRRKYTANKSEKNSENHSDSTINTNNHQSFKYADNIYNNDRHYDYNGNNIYQNQHEADISNYLRTNTHNDNYKTIRNKELSPLSHRQKSDYHKLNILDSSDKKYKKSRMYPDDENINTYQDFYNLSKHKNISNTSSKYYQYHNNCKYNQPNNNPEYNNYYNRRDDEKYSTISDNKNHRKQTSGNSSSSPSYNNLAKNQPITFDRNYPHENISYSPSNTQHLYFTKKSVVSDKNIDNKTFLDNIYDRKSQNKDYSFNKYVPNKHIDLELYEIKNENRNNNSKNIIHESILNNYNIYDNESRLGSLKKHDNVNILLKKSHLNKDYDDDRTLNAFKFRNVDDKYHKINNYRENTYLKETKNIYNQNERYISSLIDNNSINTTDKYAKDSRRYSNMLYKRYSSSKNKQNNATDASSSPGKSKKFTYKDLI
ncbi:hypothetical protein EDEG_00343 [Edhazardia aedis USNM 41457]|uniref:Uncharacterized protein n=1 Tax=Edhazardia aedis (strain USNM 41457) TaxID=1003232 RepID=J9D2K7_EDHAE|nr:hypothetical protein EDEG_00343 [Edhazardia aedis USNM 41457]|eukprot:EJW01819.1 hypothetical protein EDEG_00343 [Edhazardia aedis USNM 41457]